MGTDLRHTPVVGGEEGYPDLTVRPDPATLRVAPWEPEVASCLADLSARRPDHWPSCPRGAARQRRASAGMRLGLVPIVGPELEFFLSSATRRRRAVCRRHVDELSHVYTVGPQADPAGGALKMLLWAEALGLEAFAGNHEFMNCQYEINLQHSAPLDAADRAFRLKAAVKDIAASEGSSRRSWASRSTTRAARASISTSRSPTRRAATPSRTTTRRGPPRAAHVHRRRDRARPGLHGAPRARPSTRTGASSPTASPRRTRTGASTTAPRSAACPTSAASRTRVEIRMGDGSACPHLDRRGAPARRARRHRARARRRPTPSPATPTAWTTPTPARSCLPTSVPRSTRSRPTRGSSSARPGARRRHFVAMKRFEVERFTEAVGELDLEVVSEWEVQEYASHL